MEKKLQKPNPISYSSVTDLWQTYYRNFLMISLKEFIKLNLNMDRITKKCKECGNKYKDCKCYLE